MSEKVTPSAIDDLVRACKLFCDWHDTGTPAVYGDATTYPLVASMRQALAKLEEHPAQPIATVDADYAARIDDPTGDIELDHETADRLLCELLTRLGYVKTVEAFNSLEKWYSQWTFID